MINDQIEKLDVWRLSKDFCVGTYKITKLFPKEELFGITSQLRRAVISISLNIAEGKGRYHIKEYIQFLYLARGSAYEVNALLTIVKELRYISESELTEFEDKLETIIIKLNALIKSLKPKSQEPRARS